MIDHVWSVLAQGIAIDRDTNNISLFNVIEQVQVAAALSPEIGGYPLIGFELVTLWSRSKPDAPARGEGRVVISSPSGELLAELPYNIDLTAHERTRQRTRFVGIPAKGSGKYRFQTEFRQDDNDKWEPVSCVPLTVILPEDVEVLPDKEGDDPK